VGKSYDKAKESTKLSWLDCCGNEKNLAEWFRSVAALRQFHFVTHPAVNILLTGRVGSRGAKLAHLMFDIMYRQISKMVDDQVEHTNTHINDTTIQGQVKSWLTCVQKHVRNPEVQISKVFEGMKTEIMFWACVVLGGCSKENSENIASKATHGKDNVPEVPEHYQVLSWEIWSFSKRWYRTTPWRIEDGDGCFHHSYDRKMVPALLLELQAVYDNSSTSATNEQRRKRPFELRIEGINSNELHIPLEGIEHWVPVTTHAAREARYKLYSGNQFMWYYTAHTHTPHTNEITHTHTHNNQQSTINNQQSTINSQQSTININNQQSTINNQQSTINNQQSTINNQQSTINNQQSTINNQQSTINNQQSTINNQQSTINNQQSTINNQQSTINNHQQSSTINNQQSTINNQQSTINNQKSTINNRLPHQVSE
jgi:hypothetical protein